MEDYMQTILIIKLKKHECNWGSLLIWNPAIYVIIILNNNVIIWASHMEP